MKGSNDLQAFCKEVAEQDESAQDFLVDTRSAHYRHEDNELMIVDPEKGCHEQFEVHDHAHGQIQSKLGIPKKFYDRLRNDYPSLMEDTVNSIFHNEPEKRMVRTVHGTARAFLSDQYRRIDNFDIVSAVLPILREMEVELKSCNVGFEKMYLKATFPKVEGDIEPGDPVQAGICISNSEVGAASARFEPFLYRLACKNGMTRKDHGLQQVHLGASKGNTNSFVNISDRTKRKEDEVVVSKMRDIIESLTHGDLFQKILNESKRAKDREIEDPNEFVEELGSSRSLTQEEQDSIVNEIARNEHDLTQWGAANAVSRYSQRVESYNRASELEALSGDILSMDDKEFSKFSRN